jgi:hypothetical protein
MNPEWPVPSQNWEAARKEFNRQNDDHSNHTGPWTGRKFKEFSDYYMSHEDYDKKRQWIYHRANYECEYCHVNGSDCVHHKCEYHGSKPCSCDIRHFYRFRFREQPKDLMALCTPCHRIFHPHPKPGASETLTPTESISMTSQTTEKSRLYTNLPNIALAHCKKSESLFRVYSDMLENWNKKYKDKLARGKEAATFRIEALEVMLRYYKENIGDKEFFKNQLEKEEYSVRFWYDFRQKFGEYLKKTQSDGQNPVFAVPSPTRRQATTVAPQRMGDDLLEPLRQRVISAYQNGELEAEQLPIHEVLEILKRAG